MRMEPRMTEWGRRRRCVRSVAGRLLALMLAAMLLASWSSVSMGQDSAVATEAEPAAKEDGAASLGEGAANNNTPAATAEEKVEVEESFSVMMLDNQLVGFNRYLREVGEDGRVTSSVWMRMKFGRGGAVMESRIRFQEIATADGRLISFVYIDGSGSGENRIDGRLEDGKLLMEETVAGVRKKRVIDWPEGALGREGERLLALKQPAKEGHKFSYKAFSHSEQTFMDVETTVMDEREIELLDGKATARLYRSRVRREGLNIVVDEYMDSNSEALRMDTNLGGMQFSEFLCDKTAAMASFRPHDIFGDTLLESTSHLPDDAAAVIIKLRLKDAPGIEDLSFPATGAQRVTIGDDGIVTLRYELLNPKKGQPLPYKGDDEEALRCLKPSRTVQSDDEKIIAAAHAAVGDSTDAAEASARIARWVSRRMRPDGSVGYASASEVIRDLRGDCTEYSVITTALCRAAGIPARLASGYMYVDDWHGRKKVFGGHAWTQIYVNGEWFDLDASLDMPPYRTAGRILIDTATGDEPTNTDELALRGAMTIISSEPEVEKAPATAGAGDDSSEGAAKQH